jgi:lanosterol synthase
MQSTDYSRWRLKLGPGGSHSWQYLESDEECGNWPQTDIDRYWLGISLVSRAKFSLLMI